MSNLLMRCGAVLVAAGWLVAGCSAHTDVGADVGAARPVHASAAQRIDLGPGAAAPTSAAGVTAAVSATRLVPEAPEVIRLPDGSVGVKVAQRYFHTIVACRRSDGTFTTECPARQEPRL